MCLNLHVQAAFKNVPYSSAQAACQSMWSKTIPALACAGSKAVCKPTHKGCSCAGPSHTGHIICAGTTHDKAHLYRQTDKCTGDDTVGAGPAACTALADSRVTNQCRQGQRCAGPLAQGRSTCPCSDKACRCAHKALQATHTRHSSPLITLTLKTTPASAGTSWSPLSSS